MCVWVEVEIFTKHVRTFEPDVDVLTEPRVDAIGGGVFGDGVVLEPAPTGETIEVLTGGHGPVHLTEDGTRWGGGVGR